MPHFDLCVIGSGSGNSLIDERFADWSVALVDDGVPFGGTCLNKGCIPTKMFVYPADLCALPAQAARVDVTMAPPAADFAAIRDRIFGRIDPISEGGEQWRRSNANVTLYREPARFTGLKQLAVGDETITADRFPRARRGGASAMMGLGMQLGGLIGVMVATTLAAQIGIGYSVFGVAVILQVGLVVLPAGIVSVAGQLLV